MSADHILVVMHGEIIESGSHQNLINAKGKYHDLWSKQIFVTPNTECERSKNLKNGEAHISNDAKSATQTIELATALRHLEQKQNSIQEERKAVGPLDKSKENNENCNKKQVSNMAVRWC